MKTLTFFTIIAGIADADIGQQLIKKSDEVSRNIVTSVTKEQHQTSERIKLELKILELRNKIASANMADKPALEKQLKNLETLKSQL